MNQDARGGPPSLADMVHQPAPAAVQAFGKAVWMKIAVIGLLFVAAHYWQPRVLLQQWQDPNWSHGYLIPLFSLYLLYSCREELFAARRKTCLVGLAVMFAALAGEVASFYFIKNNWFLQISMVLMLFGVVLYLAGPQVIRVTWLPIWFLILAMPLPDRLYTQIALPLQNLAAGTAAAAMKLVGVHVDATASQLEVVSVSGNIYPLTVAGACSGLRSLMAFVALSVAIAYLENRPVWQRVVLVAAAIPVAVFCNLIRVIITCAANVLDKPQFGREFMHEFTGMAMLIPAFGLLWLLGKLMQALFLEVEEGPQDRPAGSPEGVEP